MLVSYTWGVVLHVLHQLIPQQVSTSRGVVELFSQLHCDAHPFVPKHRTEASLPCCCVLFGCCCGCCGWLLLVGCCLLVVVGWLCCSFVVVVCCCGCCGWCGWCGCFRRGLTRRCACMHRPELQRQSTKTDWWQVTWESTLLATPPPPLPCLTQETTTLQAIPRQRSSDCQGRRAHGSNVQIFKCNRLGQIRQPKHHLCTLIHSAILKITRRRGGRESTSRPEFNFT